VEENLKYKKKKIKSKIYKKTNKMLVRYNYCSNCKEYGHKMVFCPTIIYRMYKGQGHITVNCSKRGQCLFCEDINHKQKNCLEKECNVCGRKGHKAINCKRYNLIAIKNRLD
jgi:hypothetical protein